MALHSCLHEQTTMSACLQPLRGFEHAAGRRVEQRRGVQVVAVVAHELGHWKLGHTVCLMATQSTIMLAQFVLFAVFRSSGHLLRSFGFEAERPVIVALMLFMMVIGPLDSLIGWCFNLLSRRCASLESLIV